MQISQKKLGADYPLQELLMQLIHVCEKVEDLQIDMGPFINSEEEQQFDYIAGRLWSLLEDINSKNNPN